MDKINWADAKTAYITGTESYADLALRLGIAKSHLSRVAAREKWPEARRKYREKTVTKAAQLASRAHARKLSKIYEASNMLDTMVLRMLETLTKEGFEIINGNGTPCRELESLSKALLNNDELKRRLNNMLLPKEAAQLDIAREKLELDRKRMEKDEQADRTITIEFADPEMQDYAK